MRKITQLIIICLLTVNTAFAQKIIDLGDVDFLEKTGSSIEMKFLKKLNETTYTQVLLEPKDGNISIRIDTISSNNLKYYYNLTSLKDVKAMSISEWEKILKDKTYYLGKGEYNQGRTVFTTHNDFLMSIGTYLQRNQPYVDTLTRYNYSYSEVSTEFFNYTYLKVQDNKYIVAMINPSEHFSHIEELIVPYGNTLSFLIKNHKLNTGRGYKSNESSNRYYMQDLELNKFYKKRYKSDGKVELTDFLSQPIGIVGDSIQFVGNNIINYNQQTKRYELYTALGERLPIENIRAIKYSGILQLLVGNELKYFLYNEFIDMRPMQRYFMCGSVSYYEDSIVRDKKGRIRMKSTTNRRFMGNGENNLTYTLTNPNGIDSLYFYGGNRFISYSDNNYDNPNNGIIYVKKESGKWNICSYEKSEKRREFTLKYLLLKDCDNLILSYPTYFYEGGLVGYYPIVQAAMYKSLDLHDNFLRYEDVNGIKGWLDMHSLQEFPDV